MLQYIVYYTLLSFDVYEIIINIQQMEKLYKDVLYYNNVYVIQYCILYITLVIVVTLYNITIVIQFGASFVKLSTRLKVMGTRLFN